jgi:hypothetical protein
MKKAKKIIKKIALILAVILLCCLVKICSMNTFRQMSFLYKSFGYGIFNKVTELENVTELDYSFSQFSGILDISYKENFLVDDILVYIDLENDDSLKISCTYKFAPNYNAQFHIRYVYEDNEIIYEPLFILHTMNDNKSGVTYDEETIRTILEEYGITDDNIREIQDYVIYDVVVKTWTNAYHQISAFEKWKVSKMKFADNTFNFSE